MKSKRRIRALNKKASAIEKLAEGEQLSVEALNDSISGASLKMPVGCTTIFDTGWETNPRSNFPIGNCQPSSHDYLGCAGDCWWPAQNPDGLTNYEDLASVCNSIARDWRDIK